MRQLWSAILLVLLVTPNVFAASIDGRFGITGKAGGIVSLKDHFIDGTTDSGAKWTADAKPGIAAGGGLIFGVGKGLAIEVDAMHAMNFDVEIGGNKAYEAELTDVGVGIQYRIAPHNRLVPFIGVGADFIRGQLTYVGGTNYSLDWTEGGHVNLGMDYFITRGIVLTVDARGIWAAKGDVKSGGEKRAEYDPTSFLGSVGFRFILPESAFW